ncbi:hypothetical protein ACN23B_21590 [Anabaena sp. FACHB-709]|nr:MULTISPECIES: hypothetical protein [Nostocaceae]HBW33400.1 hypothetical protein [Nostoc sp. UBA8866]MBD2173629.1 hypothetical protein [Anabaena cylindrica FACHB-318]MBD2265292.1 hypothetical protein [Anabaena sp. FACHB-709]MBD2275284.1 hypothetical protein [Nostoc sp. PCC 7120 = FACHB-418]MBD2285731.1 hypothetical protein [Anabaena cylindrica FACHB-170]
MIATTSTIDELIRNQNPFAGHIVVRPQQIWGKSYPDVPSINAHASNAVFDAVEKIHNGKRETVGITITAEKGLGKSHLISRIRHRLQTEENTLFIYMSKYDNLNQIKYQFQQTVACSLRAFGSQKVMQWQEIAAALINEAKNCQYTPQQYISNIYPTWLNKYSTKTIDGLTETVLKIKHDVTNPYIIRAILWTLSTAHAHYATCWLSGLEITGSQSDVLGLPNPKNEDREAEALSNVRQILDITSHYRVPVICFDELDIAEISDTGFTAAQIIANLTKDLYNNLKQGVLLLSMYPETWNEQIRALPQAEAVIDRLVSEQSDRQPISLKYLNSDDIVALVQQWLKEFYQENEHNPPHTLYPFDETKLRELGRGKPTIRSVLKWCAENFFLPSPLSGERIIPTPPAQILHPVKPYFDSELANVEASIDSLMEEDATIADALWLAFNSLVGETLEGVIIEEIEEIEASTADQGYIDFRIVSKNRKQRIGVAVVQKDGTYIGAALKRLVDYKKFDLTRGCLVRSKNISPGAALAREKLKTLLKQKGGEWVGLQSQDIKPLLAIYFVWYNSESYELTEEQIFDFIEQKQIAINNPLIREILSDPSGQEPTNLTDDGLPISIPQSFATSDHIDLTL